MLSLFTAASLFISCKPIGDRGKESADAQHKATEVVFWFNDWDTKL